MKEAVFFIIMALLVWFIFYRLPLKNKRPKLKDLISTDSEETCKEFHKTHWANLTVPIQIEEVRGDNNPISYWHVCMVCNTYRR
jgi:hypothetical protein